MSPWHQPGLLPDSPDVDACKRTGTESMRANMDKMRSHLACAANNTASASLEISHHLLCLHTTLLLCKVAGLLSILRLKHMDSCCCCQQNVRGCHAASTACRRNSEEHILSLFLIQMARPLMKPMLKEDLALDTLYLSWACQLHRDLLPSSIPRLLQAVASDIVSGT